MEFNCQYKVQGLNHTPLSMDYWPDPENPNEAILVWGDTGGFINALHFLSASIALFERPPAPAGEKQGTVYMDRVIIFVRDTKILYQLMKQNATS